VIKRDIQQGKTVRRHVDRSNRRDSHNVACHQQQSEPSVLADQAPTQPRGQQIGRFVLISDARPRQWPILRYRPSFSRCRTSGIESPRLVWSPLADPPGDTERMIQSKRKAPSVSDKPPRSSNRPAFGEWLSEIVKELTPGFWNACDNRFGNDS
jgi:hypothetical protein